MYTYMYIYTYRAGFTEKQVPQEVEGGPSHF